MAEELQLVVLVGLLRVFRRVGGRGDGAAGGEGLQARPEVEPAHLLDAGSLLVVDVVVLRPLLLGLRQAAVLAVGPVGALDAPAQNSLALFAGQVVQELEGAVGIFTGDGDGQAGAAGEGPRAAVALALHALKGHGEGHQHAGRIVGFQSVQADLDHGALVVGAGDAAGADLGLQLLIGLHEHLRVCDAQVPHAVEHEAEFLLEVLGHDDLGLQGFRIDDGQAVVLVTGQEAGAAVLHGRGAPGFGGLGDADDGGAVIGGVGLDVLDDQVLPLLKGGDLGVTGLFQQVHAQVVAGAGVDGVLGGVRAEPIDVAVFLRHQLELGLGEAVLDVGRILDVVVERDEGAGREVVAGGVARGHDVRILARGDQKGGLLADVRADQVLDLQLDVGLLLQPLAHRGVQPGVDRRGGGRGVEEVEGRGGALGHFLRRLLFAAIGGRSVARRGFRRGGRRLGRRRTTGEHGHNHHQRQDDGDALLQGHGNSSFCFLAHARGNMNSLCPYSLKMEFTKISLKNQVLFRDFPIKFCNVKRSWEEHRRKGISFRL